MKLVYLSREIPFGAESQFFIALQVVGATFGRPLMKGFYRKVKENSKMNWRKTL